MANTICTENIQTTLYAMNSDFAGRLGMKGYDETKPLRIHRRNRPFVWNEEMQKNLLDSILKGYYIPPIICCSHIVNNREIRQIMDAGNRVTTIRKIFNGEIRDLTPSEYQKVCSHPITYVVMKNLNSSEEREMFRRLNKSVKVSDGQLYSMSEEDSPLVQEALAMLNDINYPLRARITDVFFDTVDKDNNGKKYLENAIAIVSGALHGAESITKSFSRQEENVECQLPIDRSKITKTISLILDIFQEADVKFPLKDRRKKKAQWAVGLYIGAMLYDILNYNTNIPAVITKWSDYLVKVRRGALNAKEAIEISGAQNITPDKLKRKSFKVNIFLRENRMVSEEELKKVKHISISDEESDEEEEETDEDETEEED